MRLSRSLAGLNSLACSFPQTLELGEVLEHSTYLNHGRLEEMVESHVDLLYYLQVNSPFAFTV